MNKSIETIQSEIRSGSENTDSIVKGYQERIRILNPKINAFIHVCDPEAIQGELEKPLAGVTFGLKDLFNTRGVPTTGGAKFWKENLSPDDAYIVRKIKEAGAVILGKTNMHEIALGVTNNNPHYGACRNPWDLQRISGGSSGGSAAAVAAGLCTAALGSDTGGSIRIPSALCGVVGLKPTFGRISLGGVIPLSWNLDHVGPITNCVRDAAILLEVIEGYDPHDPNSADLPGGNCLAEIEDGIKNWRIAWLAGDYIDDSDLEVTTAIRESIEVFKNLGTITEKMEISWLKEAAQANGIMTQADGAAFHFERLVQSPQEFGEDVLRRLKTGLATTSSEYSRCRRTQAEIKRKFKILFGEFDLLILPTTPDTAPPIEGKDAVEVARRLTRFTAPFNLAGLPAISVPCGFSKAGLPIGLQIVSNEWAESKVLRAARAYERATNWHQVRPDIQW